MSCWRRRAVPPHVPRAPEDPGTSTLKKACADKEYLKRIVKKNCLAKWTYPGRGNFLLRMRAGTGTSRVCAGAPGGVVWLSLALGWGNGTYILVDESSGTLRGHF